MSAVQGASEAASEALGLTGHIRRHVLGLVLGLFLSRVIAETSVHSWRLAYLVPLVVLCIAAGVLLAAALRRVAPRAWPIGILAIYVVWPIAAPALSSGLAVGAVVMLSILNLRDRGHGASMGALVFLVGLGLYVSTLAPTVLPADSGELQIVASLLGIAHPPGYPLYTIVGKVFSLIPLGDAAYRVNLFGAVCAALTLACLAGSIRRRTRSSAAALVAALALGASATFWAQGTVANIRSLTALLVALCVGALLSWGASRDSRSLIVFAACLGLGVGHHASIALLGPVFLAFVLVTDPEILRQPKRWLGPLLAFGLSLLLLLYLPIRSATGAEFDPSPIRSGRDLWNHVTAAGFRGDMLRYRTWDALWPRLGVWVQIIRLQFGPLLPWVMAASGAFLIVRRWRLALLLIGVWLINTVTAITYRAPQTVEYLIPSYVAIAAILGCGLGLAADALKTRRSVWACLVAALVIAVLAYGVPNYGSYRLLSRDTSARDYAEAILQDAPDRAAVLSSWHRATAFWYLQRVENLRPDVEVLYVYPEGATPNALVWLRRIGDELERRPVIVTNWFHAYEGSRYYWVPFHQAWEVRTEPLTEIPAGVEHLQATFEEDIRLEGYELEADTAMPGSALDVRVVWRVLAPLERDYSSFVQLVGPEGVVAQGDKLHQSRGYMPGEVRVDAYTIPLLLHASPGEYQLITGFYYTTADGWQRLAVSGGDAVPLSAVHVRHASVGVATGSAKHQSYEGGLRLRGIEQDAGIPEQMRTYIHWRQASPAFDVGPWRESELLDLSVQAWIDGDLLAQSRIGSPEADAHIVTALDVPSDVETFSLRIVDASGRLVPRLGPWHRRLSTDWSVSALRRARYVPLGGEIAYVGMPRLTVEVTPGDVAWFHPELLSMRPLLHDYSVSFGLRGESEDWEIKSDGTPALGAIPTLKWLAGWQVEDPRSLDVTPETPHGQARLTLEVYDAFTLHPLQILDERLVRQGQGVTLDLGDVEIIDP